MEYNKVIECGFRMFVNETFPKQDVRDFLLNHERLNVMVENLSGQLKDTEKTIIKLRSSQDDRRKMVKDLIKDFSNTFCKAALEEFIIRRGINGQEKNDSEEKTGRTD